MALTLYVGSRRYATWSLRAYLALARTRVAYEVKTILLDQAGTKAQIAAVTPAARVPVLHDGDLVVWDSLAICEYLAERVPAAQLWPADVAQRARARAISAEMHSGFGSLREQMPMDILAHKPGQGHTPAALADVRRVHDIWRECLAASGGPFLFGDFTIADAMYAPVATRFTTYGVELDAVCRAYVERIYADTAMKQWLADAATEPEAHV